MRKYLAPILAGLGVFVIAAAALAGGYLLHQPGTRVQTRTVKVTVTKTVAAKPVTKMVDDPGLLKCAQLLRDTSETWTLFYDQANRAPGLADGFNPPLSATCGRYVKFGTQYALARPPAAKATTAPPMPHVNGATHSEIVNCLQAQCTTLPGAGPNGGTCGEPVDNEQECAW